MDIASKIIALIVSAIGAGVTFYNTFFKSESKRKKKYYESLLQPFIRECDKGEAFNTAEFVKNTADRVDDNIPKYIFYLVDLQTAAQNSKEKHEPTEDNLKKVLIADYLNLYPNENTKKCDFFDIIRKLFDYTLILLSFYFIFLGALIISNQCLSLVSNILTNSNAIFDYLFSSLKTVLLGILILFIGAFPVLLTEWLSKDIYTVKKKRIQKIISTKIKRYDKRIDEYVL